MPKNSVRQRVMDKVGGGHLRNALERASWKNDEIEYVIDRLGWMLFTRPKKKR